MGMWGQVIAGWRWLPILLAPAALPAAAGETGEPLRNLDDPAALFIALDAIAYDVVAELAEREGLFESFGRPIPLVGAFPSSTSVTFGGMFDDLGVPHPPGYEARYYDLETGRMRGGGLFSYKNTRPAWHDLFDWKLDRMLQKAWGYFRPRPFAKKEVRLLVESLERKLKDNDSAPAIFAYLVGGDALGHRRGPAAVRDMLHELDEQLIAMRERLDTPFRLLLYSDHGMAGNGEALRNLRMSVNKAVKAAGFRVARRVRRDNQLVFVRLGLLGSLVAYSAAGRERAAAGAIASVPGISLCSTREDVDSWQLYADSQLARIERRRAGQELYWRYRRVNGDPLGYGSMQARLESTPDGWVHDSLWYSETLEHRYPDALYRVAAAFELVQNPASVLCSLAPGYMYGPNFTFVVSRLTVGKLRYTHGSLDRGQTLGFLVSDDPLWSGKKSVRFDELFEFFPAVYGSR